MRAVVTAVVMQVLMVQALLAQAQVQGTVIEARAEVRDPITVKIGGSYNLESGRDIEISIINNTDTGVLLMTTTEGEDAIRVYPSGSEELVYSLKLEGKDEIFLRAGESRTFDLDGEDVDSDELTPGVYDVMVNYYILDAEKTYILACTNFDDCGCSIRPLLTNQDGVSEYHEMNVVAFHGNGKLQIGVTGDDTVFAAGDPVEFVGISHGSRMVGKAWYRIERVTDCDNPYPEVVYQQTCSAGEDLILEGDQPEVILEWADAASFGAGRYVLKATVGKYQTAFPFEIK